MKLFDLFEQRPEQQPRAIVGTSRFKAHYHDFAHKYRDLSVKLQEFLAFRRTARPDQPFNVKDGQMVNDSVRGLRRCHLIHGKALILYMISRDTIDLIDMVEHDAIEGRNMKAMSRYIASLTPQSFSPFSVPAEPAKPAKVVMQPLTTDQKEQLLVVFKMMAEHPEDRKILDAAARGSLDGFLEWARYAMGFEDASQDKAIVQALGGRQMIMQWAQMWLKVSQETS